MDRELLLQCESDKNAPTSVLKSSEMNSNTDPWKSHAERQAKEDELNSI